MTQSILYYGYDPMCSWCYGYKKKIYNLIQNLPQTVKLEKVLGGLAFDTQEPMPIDLQQKLQATWTRISKTLNVEFNFDFWTKCQPRRSTYMACRACIIARDYQLEDEMIEQIQISYYLEAKNPSEIDELVFMLIQIGINQSAESLTQKLNSQSLNERLIEEIDFTRTIGLNSFPSLILQHQEELYPISLDYRSEKKSINEIKQIIATH